jgi:hypothetical protein
VGQLLLFNTYTFHKKNESSRSNKRGFTIAGFDRDRQKRSLDLIFKDYDDVKRSECESEQAPPCVGPHKPAPPK